ncbi:helix-turn-helix domain-containing protein [Streptomyces sp. NPDC003247]|uniref:helix-turn-helix domain-containing protein n=1 Tax=Streptomyces sp. NPDC003247 TaxID=3364677 RepID=UPI0036AA86F8
MAEKKPNAVARPSQGVEQTTTPSGVTHVRAFQSGQYTVVGNHLAQHRELSLTAIGLAAHILSLPEGAPVDIRSLADRFPEGRDRIAFALRELEAHGYLERVRERTEAGRLFTRTYAHHTPGATAAQSAPARVPAARPRGRSAPVRLSGDDRQAPQEDDDRGADRPPSRDAHTAPVAARPPGTPERSAEAPERRAVPQSPPEEDADAPRDARHERAVALLAGLRRTDSRLTLSARDVRTLAPAVTAWFDHGAPASVVHHILTTGLPDDMRHPAAVLGYRLRELLPAPLPAIPAPPPVPADAQAAGHRPHPFQTCDGCERAFRAPHPGRCRDCRSRSEPSTTVSPLCAA